eukprot:CAMPEP_0185266748 /NCGR_PEP_ID=MMETSP1359-20130426/32159_1 /TAXON_ID=552665 /ORGANISM="Bigelowiella longifila, Strain CCMP242" /LENGTH=247 /DNA_ID=CAMNT_0027856719 /DNA_START=1 /DNA_END=741 /DNA_ORIENTATION=-
MMIRRAFGGLAGKSAQMGKCLSNRGFNAAKLGHNVIEPGCREYARSHRYASAYIKNLRYASKDMHAIGRRLVLVEAAAKGRKIKRSGGGSGGRRSSSSNKGFRGFGKVPNDDNDGDDKTPSCICGTLDTTYDDCCGKYHAGVQLPPTPEALMRSRFSAFVLGDAEYIIKTTHPSNPEQPTTAGLESFFAEYKVKNLKIDEHRTSHDGEKGKVKFTYTQSMIRGGGGSANNYTELSDFQRDKHDGGMW